MIGKRRKDKFELVLLRYFPAILIRGGKVRAYASHFRLAGCHVFLEQIKTGPIDFQRRYVQITERRQSLGKNPRARSDLQN
jgi:hypothetical protein